MRTKEKGPVAAGPHSDKHTNIIQLSPTLRQNLTHLSCWSRSHAIGLLMDHGVIPDDAPGYLLDYRLPRYKVINGIQEALRSPSDAR